MLNLFLLWLLSAVWGWWYLLASVVSYGLSTIWNFLLQRAWAFDGRSGILLRQASLFVMVNLAGLVLNTTIVYLLVETMSVWYLAAQAAASVVVAVQSFFAYRWIFKQPRVLGPASGSYARR